MKTRLSFVAIAMLALTFACATANAHVTVWPRESTTGAYEKYVVRVPTEGKVATTSIELFLPVGVTFVSIGTPSGFKYSLNRAGDRVTSIVWTMQIAPGEFAEFAFMARNASSASSLSWRAVQHFADGSSTEWSGAKGDKHPASVTSIVAGNDSAHH